MVDVISLRKQHEAVLQWLKNRPIIIEDNNKSIVSKKTVGEVEEMAVHLNADGSLPLTPAALEELADIFIFAFQLVPSQVIHSVIERSIRSPGRFEDIESSALKLERTNGRLEHALRLLAHTISFAVRSGVNPLPVVEIKNKYNDERFPAHLFQNGALQEAYSKSKAEEKARNMKTNVLYPSYASMLVHGVALL